MFGLFKYIVILSTILLQLRTIEITSDNDVLTITPGNEYTGDCTIKLFDKSTKAYMEAIDGSVAEKSPLTAKPCESAIIVKRIEVNENTKRDNSKAISSYILKIEDSTKKTGIYRFNDERTSITSTVSLGASSLKMSIHLLGKEGFKCSIYSGGKKFSIVGSIQQRLKFLVNIPNYRNTDNVDLICPGLVPLYRNYKSGAPTGRTDTQEVDVSFEDSSLKINYFPTLQNQIYVHYEVSEILDDKSTELCSGESAKYCKTLSSKTVSLLKTEDKFFYRVKIRTPNLLDKTLRVSTIKPKLIYNDGTTVIFNLEEFYKVLGSNMTASSRHIYGSEDNVKNCINTNEECNELMKNYRILNLIPNQFYELSIGLNNQQSISKLFATRRLVIPPTVKYDTINDEFNIKLTELKGSEPYCSYCKIEVHEMINGRFEDTQEINCDDKNDKCYGTCFNPFKFKPRQKSNPYLIKTTAMDNTCVFKPLIVYPENADEKLEAILRLVDDKDIRVGFNQEIETFKHVDCHYILFSMSQTSEEIKVDRTCLKKDGCSQKCVDFTIPNVDPKKSYFLDFLVHDNLKSGAHPILWASEQTSLEQRKPIVNEFLEIEKHADFYVGLSNSEPSEITPPSPTDSSDPVHPAGPNIPKEEVPVSPGGSSEDKEDTSNTKPSEPEKEPGTPTQPAPVIPKPVTPTGTGTPTPDTPTTGTPAPDTPTTDPAIPGDDVVINPGDKDGVEETGAVKYTWLIILFSVVGGIMLIALIGYLIYRFTR